MVRTRASRAVAERNMRAVISALQDALVAMQLTQSLGYDDIWQEQTDEAIAHRDRVKFLIRALVDLFPEYTGEDLY